MSVHVYICQYMCIYVSTCVYLSVHVYICQYMCIYVSTCVYMSVHVYICQYMCIYVSTCVYLIMQVHDFLSAYGVVLMSMGYADESVEHFTKVIKVC